ncbi:TerC family protein [Raineyella fluvialis]|uniref:TerC/Alx family metal homeostasis membrane protein n=1 Tax=Raineyella fluvialis TaxID=2662261 RepID=A0A5Q2FDZ7_9ACTN|nr:TerC family protein [Raineyella fluvialis]QGF23674.1 TerC/Alx family metal homeostasis membrane protein [Raineyella fluvialis]
MAVSPLVWTLTVALIVGMLVFDFVFHARTPHVPTMRESALWSAAYVGIALVFGVFVWVSAGADLAGQYYAGYLTEKALSVDNLFVFLIIMASFAVPRQYQEEVLLFGIAFSLVARTGLILVGAGLINAFAWVFYLFAVILLVTAGSTLKGALTEKEDADSGMVRLVRRIFRTSDGYDGNRLVTRVDGRRVMTPMLLVMIAIGGTDLLFALDSIPAIFGLTQETYLAFTAVAFSLLGLKQLYFLIDGLLDRLIYLSYGLSAILAFIAVKLGLHALHENNVPFINDGRPVHVAEISTGLSLAVIVGVLVLTVTASLVSRRGRALTVIAATQSLSERYLALPDTAAESHRRAIRRRLARLLARMPAIPDELKEDLITDKRHFHDLLERVHGAGLDTSGAR